MKDTRKRGKSFLFFPIGGPPAGKSSTTTTKPTAVVTQEDEQFITSMWKQFVSQPSNDETFDNMISFLSGKSEAYTLSDLQRLFGNNLRSFFGLVTSQISKYLRDILAENVPDKQYEALKRIFFEPENPDDKPKGAMYLDILPWLTSKEEYSLIFSQTQLSSEFLKILEMIALFFEKNLPEDHQSEEDVQQKDEDPSSKQESPQPAAAAADGEKQQETETKQNANEEKQTENLPEVEQQTVQEQTIPSLNDDVVALSRFSTRVTLLINSVLKRNFLETIEEFRKTEVLNKSILNILGSRIPRKVFFLKENVYSILNNTFFMYDKNLVEFLSKKRFIISLLEAISCIKLDPPVETPSSNTSTPLPSSSVPITPTHLQRSQSLMSSIQPTIGAVNRTMSTVPPSTVQPVLNIDPQDAETALASINPQPKVDLPTVVMIVEIINLLLTTTTDKNSVLFKQFITAKGVEIVNDMLLHFEDSFDTDGVLMIKLVKIAAGICFIGIPPASGTSTQGSSSTSTGKQINQTILRNVKAFQEFCNIFHLTKKMELQQQIYQQVLFIFSEDPKNYASVHPFHTLVPMVKNLMKFEETIQIAILKLLEYVVLVLNFVPTEEMRILCSVLGSEITPELFEKITALISKMIEFNSSLKTTFCESKLLESMLFLVEKHFAPLLKFAPQQGLKESEKLQKKLLHIVNHMFIAMFRECKENIDHFRQADGISVLQRLLVDELYRDFSLGIFQYIILQDEFQSQFDVQILVDLLQTSSRENFDLKCAIFNSLAKLFLVNDRAKDSFRDAGAGAGFIITISVIINNQFPPKNDLVLPAIIHEEKPQELSLSEGSEETTKTYTVQDTLRLLDCVLYALCAVMHNHFWNKSQFLKQVGQNALAESLKLCGAFGVSKNATIQILQHLFDLADERVVLKKIRTQKQLAAERAQKNAVQNALTNPNQSNIQQSVNSTPTLQQMQEEQEMKVNSFIIPFYPSLNNNFVIRSLVSLLPDLEPSLQAEILETFVVFAKWSSFNVEQMCSCSILDDLLKIYADIFQNWDEEALVFPHLMELMHCLASHRISLDEMRNILKLTHQEKQKGTNHWMKFLLEIAQPKPSFSCFRLEPTNSCGKIMSLDNRPWPPVGGFSFASWISFEKRIFSSIEAFQENETNESLTLQYLSKYPLYENDEKSPVKRRTPSTLEDVFSGKAVFNHERSLSQNRKRIRTENSSRFALVSLFTNDNKSYFLITIKPTGCLEVQLGPKKKPITFSGFKFEEKTLYHVVFVMQKVKGVNYSLSLHVNGNCVQTIVADGATPPTPGTKIQGYLGSYQGKSDDYIWEIGNSLLTEEVLLPFAAQSMFLAGPSYPGFFQGDYIPSMRILSDTVNPKFYEVLLTRFQKKEDVELVLPPDAKSKITSVLMNPSGLGQQSKTGFADQDEQDQYELEKVYLQFEAWQREVPPSQEKALSAFKIDEEKILFFFRPEYATYLEQSMVPNQYAIMDPSAMNEISFSGIYFPNALNLELPKRLVLASIGNFSPCFRETFIDTVIKVEAKNIIYEFIEAAETIEQLMDALRLLQACFNQSPRFFLDFAVTSPNGFDFIGIILKKKQGLINKDIIGMLFNFMQHGSAPGYELVTSLSCAKILLDYENWKKLPTELTLYILRRMRKLIMHSKLRIWFIQRLKNANILAILLRTLSNTTSFSITKGIILLIKILVWKTFTAEDFVVLKSFIVYFFQESQKRPANIGQLSSNANSASAQNQQKPKTRPHSKTVFNSQEKNLFVVKLLLDLLLDLITINNFADKNREIIAKGAQVSWFILFLHSRARPIAALLSFQILANLIVAGYFRSEAVYCILKYALIPYCNQPEFYATLLKLLILEPTRHKDSEVNEIVFDAHNKPDTMPLLTPIFPVLFNFLKAFYASVYPMGCAPEFPQTSSYAFFKELKMEDDGDECFFFATAKKPTKNVIISNANSEMNRQTPIPNEQTPDANDDDTGTGECLTEKETSKDPKQAVIDKNDLICQVLDYVISLHEKSIECKTEFKKSESIILFVEFLFRNAILKTNRVSIFDFQGVPSPVVSANANTNSSEPAEQPDAIFKTGAAAKIFKLLRIIVLSDLSTNQKEKGTKVLEEIVLAPHPTVVEEQKAKYRQILFYEIVNKLSEDPVFLVNEKAILVSSQFLSNSKQISNVASFFELLVNCILAEMVEFTDYHLLMKMFSKFIENGDQTKFQASQLIQLLGSTKDGVQQSLQIVVRALDRLALFVLGEKNFTTESQKEFFQKLGGKAYSFITLPLNKDPEFFNTLFFKCFQLLFSESHDIRATARDLIRSIVVETQHGSSQAFNSMMLIKMNEDTFDCAKEFRNKLYQEDLQAFVEWVAQSEHIQIHIETNFTLLYHNYYINEQRNNLIFRSGFTSPITSSSAASTLASATMGTRTKRFQSLLSKKKFSDEECIASSTREIHELLKQMAEELEINEKFQRENDVIRARQTNEIWQKKRKKLYSVVGVFGNGSEPTICALDMVQSEPGMRKKLRLMDKEEFTSTSSQSGKARGGNVSSAKQYAMTFPINSPKSPISSAPRYNWVNYNEPASPTVAAPSNLGGSGTSTTSSNSVNKIDVNVASVEQDEAKVLQEMEDSKELEGLEEADPSSQAEEEDASSNSNVFTPGKKIEEDTFVMDMGDKQKNGEDVSMQDLSHSNPESEKTTPREKSSEGVKIEIEDESKAVTKSSFNPMSKFVKNFKQLEMLQNSPNKADVFSSSDASNNHSKHALGAFAEQHDVSEATDATLQEIDDNDMSQDGGEGLGTEGATTVMEEYGNEMIFTENDPKSDFRIRRFLDIGEIVQHIYNCLRVNGLDCTPALFLITSKNIHIIEWYNLKDDKIVESNNESSSEVSMQILSTSTTMSNQKESNLHNVTKISFNELRGVAKRRYLLRETALEFFSLGGKTYFVVFEISETDKVFTKTASLPQTTVLSAYLNSPKSVPKKAGQWAKGEISNFEYLMALNTLSGRTMNDLTQYPVFPWVLSNFSSETLDLSDPKNYRNLSKPMGALTQERAESFQKRFQLWEDPVIPKFHYGTHYSSAGAVLYYLMRLEPFMSQHVDLQGGRFDVPDRLFHNITDTWNSASSDKTMSDVKELIPEFYYLPEFLINTTKANFGARQTGEQVDDVRLPAWALGSAYEFVKTMREALESDYVSEHLHEWIDLIFGYKQTGKDAEDALNVFYYLTYENQVVDIDSIEDPIEREAKIAQISHFGQTPKQLFKKPHIKKILSATSQIKKANLPVAVSLAQQGVQWECICEKVLNMGPIGQVIESSANSAREILYLPEKCMYLPPKFDRFFSWTVPDASIRLYTANPKSNQVGLESPPMTIYEMPHCGSQIQCGAITEDGRFVALGGRDASISVWRISNKPTSHGNSLDKRTSVGPLGRLYGHSEPISVMAISSAFHIIVSASQDGHLFVWDLNRLEFLRALLIPSKTRGRVPPSASNSSSKRHLTNIDFRNPYAAETLFPVTAITIHPSSGHIIACTKNQIFVWTVNGVLLASVLSSLAPIRCVCVAEPSIFNEDDYLVATGHSNGTIGFWKLEFQRNVGYVEKELEEDEIDAEKDPKEKESNSSSTTPEKPTVNNNSFFNASTSNQVAEERKSQSNSSFVHVNLESSLISTNSSSNLFNPKYERFDKPTLTSPAHQLMAQTPTGGLTNSMSSTSLLTSPSALGASAKNLVANATNTLMGATSSLFSSVFSTNTTNLLSPSFLLGNVAGNDDDFNLNPFGSSPANLPGSGSVNSILNSPLPTPVPLSAVLEETILPELDNITVVKRELKSVSKFEIDLKHVDTRPIANLMYIKGMSNYNYNYNASITSISYSSESKRIYIGNERGYVLGFQVNTALQNSQN